ncbi:MAG: hypothetical protein RDU01_04095 [Thermodesulfovibrionales bacterium]|nr:hypothetical protein [Thermodesulfovibrionales bacterium]
MKKFFCILFVGCFVSGCAATATVISSGGLVNPSENKTKQFYDFQNDFEIVWQSVVKTCSEIDASIKIIDKASGIITAEKQLIASEDLRDTFYTGSIKLNYDIKKPSRYMARASEVYVAQTGKVVETREKNLDLLTEFTRNNIGVIFSYNIFAEKLDSNITRVNINIFAYPTAKSIRYSTSQSDAFYGHTSQSVDVDISSARFYSKGVFEKNFLSSVSKNLKIAEGTEK